MCAASWRSGLTALVAAVVCGHGVSSAAPMHEKKAVKQLAVSRSVFRAVQGGRDIGTETFERRTYDNNTIVFQADIALEPSPGTFMNQKVDFTVEEESYFPRSFKTTKSISAGKTKFDHVISVEMFANVAVIASELRGKTGTQRVVVPSGIALQETGPVLYWYQALFWYDRETGGRQRIQWLDPLNGRVGAGEMLLIGEETIAVMGKKTKVSVFTAERGDLGAATLYVDAKKRIVKCEQNLTTFELAEQTDK